MSEPAGDDFDHTIAGPVPPESPPRPLITDIALSPIVTAAVEGRRIDVPMSMPANRPLLFVVRSELSMNSIDLMVGSMDGAEKLMQVAAPEGAQAAAELRARMEGNLEELCTRIVAASITAAIAYTRPS